MANASPTNLAQEILEQIIQILPAPTGDKDKVLKCLLVDSWYDSYLGVIILLGIAYLMSNNRSLIDKNIIFSSW